jgi:tRNA G18 (ribose-2'-O)-methylase SpoU
VSRLLPIHDHDDPRIEPFRAIRERDLKGRGERFVIEGEVVLRVALAKGRFPVESVLIAENRVGPLADLIGAAPVDLPIHVAPRPVLDAIAGFPMHRGVLALGRRLAEPDLAAAFDALPDEALIVVLAGIANHDNMGGLLRNAAAFGVDLAVLDDTSCDPLYRKAIRVSAGAALTLPFVTGGPVSAIADALAQAGFSVIATSPAGTERLEELVPARRTALVFGAEGPGLPREILASLRTVRIAMAPGFDSLNVATASGIVLHHVAGRRLA